VFICVKWFSIMSKAVKLALAIFVGLDVFVAGFFLLANLRVAMFGTGSIPGGGSAIDMALFLLAGFGGWVAGDRLYYFLTYKERKAKKLNQSQATIKPAADNHTTGQTEKVGVAPGTIWDERDWDDQSAPSKAK
jgi:hypothetical protein